MQLFSSFQSTQTPINWGTLNLQPPQPRTDIKSMTPEMFGGITNSIENFFGAPAFTASGGNPITGEGGNVPRGFMNQVTEATKPTLGKFSPLAGAAAGFMEPLGPLGDASKGLDVVSQIAKSKLPDEIAQLLLKTNIDKAQIPVLSKILSAVDNPKKVKNIIEGFGSVGAKELPRPISEELQPLAQEARKYKSAEEFVKAQPAIYHGTPAKFSSFDTSKSEGNATWFTSDTKDITDNTAGAVQAAGQKLNIMERYIKPGLKLATPDVADKMYTDQLIAEGYRGVVYPKGEYGDYAWTKLFNPNEDTLTKSQLTDFYNQVKGTSEALPKPQTAGQGALPRSASTPENPPPPQDTTNNVQFSIKGTTVPQRVSSAIQNSEAIKTKVLTGGQDVYSLGRSLSEGDLKIIRDNYQTGVPIDNIAKDTSNPAAASKFLTELRNYYDFRLAADRAAGGTTGRVENYLPQSWDLSKPADLSRFNELAKQKGLQPYDGFRAQPRVFNSYAEGEAAGFTPKNSNILADLKSDYTSASNAISKQALRKGLIEAAPEKVSLSGMGKTLEGKPFINSNAPGMEGMSFHPEVQRLLQGFEPMKHPDFINLVKKSGAEAAVEKTGIGGAIDRTVAALKSVPSNAKEAGFTGVLGSIYDHVSSPLKQILWNWSGFHSVNITLNHIGASSLHPITGAKGVLQSVGSAMSERLYKASLENYKSILYKDSEGTSQSVFDWAVKSGAFEARALPAKGVSKINPFGFGKRLIFDREIPVLQLNLAQQAAKKGIIADSPQGIALGKEIRTITGEINTKTMNINPNTLRAGSRLFLAPGFTFSKYKTLLDSFTKFGASNGAAGNLARTAVIGKSAVVGLATSLGTLLATGKFPNLHQLLLNLTVNPSVQTNLKNPKGQQLDITVPKTFLSEGAGAVLDPTHYAEARLNPLISDFVKLKTNKDYYNRPIVDPNVPQSATAQIVKNIGTGHLPIGGQALVNAANGKETGTQAGLQIAGLGTRVSANDPTAQKYNAVDGAKAAIANIAPDDPQRYQKIRQIYDALTPAQKKSLNYQELLAGVKLKPPKGTSGGGGLFGSFGK